VARARSPIIAQLAFGSAAALCAIACAAWPFMSAAVVYGLSVARELFPGGALAKALSPEAGTGGGSVRYVEEQAAMAAGIDEVVRLLRQANL
jgi:hypothetical protein